MKKAGLPVYHPVRLDREYLADKALELFGKKHSGTWRLASPSRKTKVLEEFRDLISSLEESLAIDNPAFIIDYARWATVHLTAMHFPESHVSRALDVLDEVINKELPPDFRDRAGTFIAETQASLKTIPKEIPSFITADNPLADTARAFLAAVLAADRMEAERVLADTAGSGIPVKEIYLHVFQPVLQETGRLWQVQLVSIAQEHSGTASVESLMARLHDKSLSSGRGRKRGRGTTVIAAGVGAELHGLGIRMVADFFEMDGWDTYYTGANTPAISIIEAAHARKPNVIALSTTMPRYLPDLEYLIRSVRSDPATAGTKIIVGGYPFRIVPDLWQRIGADAFADTADEAVVIADRLVPVNR